MARRIPLSEANKPRSKPAKPPVEKGDETVVSLPPTERTFDIEVLDEPAAAPAPAAQPAWTPITGGAAAGEGPRTDASRKASVTWTRKPLPKWRQGFWAPFPALVALFLLGVVVQVYLAGAAVFGAVTWRPHTTWIHVIEFFPLLMVLTAFLGGRKSAGWWSVGLLAAVEVQYALASVYEVANPTRNLRLLGALHTVNALFIVGVTLLLVRRYPFWRRPGPL